MEDICLTKFNGTISPALGTHEIVEQGNLRQATMRGKTSNCGPRIWWHSRY